MKEILKNRMPIIFESNGKIDIECWELYKKLFKCTNSPYEQCAYKSWLYNKIKQYKLTYGKDYTYKLKKKDRYLQENEIDRLGIDWKAYKKNRRFTDAEKQSFKNKRIKLDCFVSQDTAIQLCIISNTYLGKLLREEVSKKIISS